MARKEHLPFVVVGDGRGKRMGYPQLVPHHRRKIQLPCAPRFQIVDACFVRPTVERLITVPRQGPLVIRLGAQTKTPNCISRTPARSALNHMGAPHGRTCKILRLDQPHVKIRSRQNNICYLKRYISLQNKRRSIRLRNHQYAVE